MSTSLLSVSCVADVIFVFLSLTEHIRLACTCKEWKSNSSFPPSGAYTNPNALKYITLTIRNQSGTKNQGQAAALFLASASFAFTSIEIFDVPLPMLPSLQGAIQNLTRLTSLRLENCCCSVELLHKLCVVLSTQLTTLSLAAWPSCTRSRRSLGATDKHAMEIRSLSKLTSLDLTRSTISDTGLAYISNLPLQHLTIRRCSAITVDGLHSLLSGLYLLSLNAADCNSVDDNILRCVKTMPLVRLELIGCNMITNTGLRQLEDGPRSLNHLDISYCTGITPEGRQRAREIGYISSIVTKEHIVFDSDSDQ
jgi:hypothetical protein